MDPQLVQQLEALYTDNTGTVRLFGSTSRRFNLSLGVRQGCVLSPLLFIAYLDHPMRGIETQCCKQGVKLEHNRDLMRKAKMGDAMFGPSRSGDIEVLKYILWCLIICRGRTSCYCRLARRRCLAACLASLVLRL